MPDPRDPADHDAPREPRPPAHIKRGPTRPAPVIDDEWDGDLHDDDHDGGYDEDGEYIEVRRSSSRRRRVLTVLVSLLVLLALAAGGLVVFVQRQIDPPGPPGKVQTISIPQGATSDEIGRLLAAEDIISSDQAWRWYLRWKGGGPFEAGDYELRKNSALPDVIEALDAGPAPIEERSFTMPEGLTVPEILARLASPEDGLGLDLATMQQLLDSGEVSSSVLGADLPSKEGILFPETYRVAADADAKAVLQQMITQLDATFTQLNVASAQERFNLSPYEILIVASLIEEETKIPEERAMVAQVIYNRLRQGIPLGIDATSRYEAEISGRSRDDIDFSSDSPYNTRRVQGLPPTPIASPGRASIEAALNPADGPWIYYVLEDAEGHHFFTDSDREFINAKNRCAELDLGCG